MGCFANFCPTNQCCLCDGRHGADFLWANISNICNVIAGVTYLVTVLSVVLLAVIGIVVLPLYLILWVPVVIWFAVDLVALAVQTGAAVVHILACWADAGLKQAFVECCSMNETSIGSLSMYNCILHWVSLVLFFFGFGILLLLVPYLISCILLILAVVIARRM